MPWTPNFKKGVDLPVWDWLPGSPDRASYHGTSNTFDGKRYIYWVIQYGTTSASASTTHLMRYDTWTEGWQYLAAVTNSAQGLDIEYDPIRNVLIIIHGTLTSWQVFNLNTTSITYANVSCGAWALTTMSPVLPATASYGASITQPDDQSVPAEIDTGTTDTGSTTTTVVATDATGSFGAGMVGLQLRFTSGTLSGQMRTISAVTNKNTLTLSAALGSAPAAGSTFVIELPSATSTGSNTTTTLQDTSASSQWVTNLYSNSDVIITGGAGSGQRRRIASNTATVLTLAAAVTGNANTGPWTTTPDATSTYRIVPSRDFLYYQPGNNTATFYRLDVSQTGTAPTWTTLTSAPANIGGGGNTFYPSAYAPFQIIAFRGNGSAGVVSYNVGTNAWTTVTTYAGPNENFNVGAGAAMMHGLRKIIVQKESSTRLYALDLLTGIYEPAGTIPYANASGYDGKRLRFVKTPDGVMWLYVLRAGGQEHFRTALEQYA